jgi:hypothetical protein
MLRVAKRWAYRVAFCLSTLLLVLTIAAWVRGQFSMDVLRYHYGYGEHCLYVKRHSVAYYGSKADVTGMDVSDEPARWFYGSAGKPGDVDDVDLMLTPMAPQGFNRGGFGFLIWGPRSRGGSHLAILKIPYWALVLISVPLPVRVAVRSIRHRRRIRLGLCARCGYDLRGSDGQCPECGERRGIVTSQKVV